MNSPTDNAAALGVFVLMAMVAWLVLAVLQLTADHSVNSRRTNTNPWREHYGVFVRGVLFPYGFVAIVGFVARIDPLTAAIKVFHYWNDEGNVVAWISAAGFLMLGVSVLGNAGLLAWNVHNHRRDWRYRPVRIGA